MRLATVSGVISGVVVLWAWGGLTEPPVIDDEAAYLLQAEIFGEGRWTSPTPEHAEFFEQAHVLMEPAVASKYPPGHSLALTPGVKLGLPGLVPVLLTAVSGALLYLLAVSLTGKPAAGVLSWLVWMVWEGNLSWRMTYFSELTTSALWLAIWFLFARWEQSRHPPTLNWIAVLVGFAAISRPFTSLAFAVPLGVYLVVRLLRARQLKRLVLPVILGSTVLLLIPAWMYFTTGSLQVTPFGLYTRQYIPWDRLGFGLDTTPPLRELPPDLIHSFDYFHALHVRYQWDRVPIELFRRVLTVLHSIGLAFGWVLAPLAVIGFCRWWRRSWLIPASVTAVFLAYLAYAHGSWWTIYYLEAIPLISVMAGYELFRIGGLVREKLPTLLSFPRTSAAVLTLAAMGAIGFAASRVKQEKEQQQAYTTEFESIKEGLVATGRIGIFISYPSDYYSGGNLQRMSANLNESPAILAIDRGSRNRVLRQQMSDRTWYRVDAVTLGVCRLSHRASAAMSDGPSPCDDGDLE